MSMASSLNESLCHAHSSSSEGGDPANEDGIVYKGGHSHDDDSGHWWESINVCPRMRERNSMDQRLFLLGLEKYGKGDQRIIFRKFVISRTPTQVASHAHKCFIRLNSINKDRRRTSIHDITTVTNGDTSPVKLMPLWKLQGSLQKFFSIICRPLIPAVGTPVNPPVPAASPMVYPLQTPFSGAIVSAPL